MAVVSDVIARIQVLMGDTAADEYTGTVCLPALNMAYDRLQIDLSNEGVKQDIEYVELTVPASTLIIGAATTPALPADFLIPHEIKERGSGSTALYDSMNGPCDLPERNPESTLQDWNWRGGKLYFIGSTAARQIRLKYEKKYPALTVSPDATIEFPLFVNALAHLTLAFMLASFNSEMSQLHWTMYEDNKTASMGIMVKVKQYQVLRRRRYSSRYR